MPLQGLRKRQHSSSGVLRTQRSCGVTRDKQPCVGWSEHVHTHGCLSSEDLLSLVPADCVLIGLPFRMSFSSNLNHYGMVHVASVSDVLLDNSFTPPCQRMGGMVSFRTFEDFVRYVGKVMVVFLGGPKWNCLEAGSWSWACLFSFWGVCWDPLICLLEIMESFRLLPEQRAARRSSIWSCYWLEVICFCADFQCSCSQGRGYSLCFQCFWTRQKRQQSS